MDLVARHKRSEGENDLPNLGPPFRVGGVGRRVRTNDPREPGPWGSGYNFYTMCQLRRLYRLHEHDPTNTPTASAPGEGTPPSVRTHLAIDHPPPGSESDKFSLDVD